MMIGVLGTRGVPANYGGFETFAEQFGRRLAARGHEVTIYGRSRYAGRSVEQYLGMRLVTLPAPRSKYLETVIHTLVSALHALKEPYDVLYVCNSANVPAVMLLHLFGRRVVLNVDGLEWKRRKWSKVGQAYYRLCARTAARLPVHIVTDARVVQQYYERILRRATHYFPYGTDLETEPDDGTLARFGLQERRYILYVSRLEPENNADQVIEAYSLVGTDLPLVIVGHAPYASAYMRRLRATTDPRVRFLGPVYGSGYAILRSHATAYVQATEVGGTHPALVEAMGSGNAILANDVPEHRETLGDAGLYYHGAPELAHQLERLLEDPSLMAILRQRARERAKRLYSWDVIVDGYEAWLRSIAS